MTRFARTAAIAAILIAGLYAAPAHAEAKIAVVDSQRILAESKQGKSLQQQIAADQKAFQDDVTKQEASLQTAQDQLNKEQQTNKNGDDVAAKKIDFEKRVLEGRQQVAKKKDELEKNADAAAQKLRGQANQVIGDIAQREHINLVLNRSDVLLADKSMDITDQVIAALDSGSGKNGVCRYRSGSDGSRSRRSVRLKSPRHG